MKNTTKANVCASALAGLLTIALAGFAGTDAPATPNGSSQKERVDFLQPEIIGSLQGHETDIPQGDPPQLLLVNGEVKGRATRLVDSRSPTT